MYRKERKIPTIFAIFLVLIGIGFTLYLDGTYQNLISKATEIPVPADIHLTNISDNSITLSYVTNEVVLGFVKVSGENKKEILVDDLDKNSPLKPRYTHMFTIKDLQADNAYTLTVLGDKNGCREAKCPEFIQRTGVKIDQILDLPPLSGQIVDNNNKPVEGAIVYLLIGKAAALSGRSDKLGKFVIPLNNLRSQDLVKRPEIDGNTTIQITIKAAVSQYASVLTNLDLIKKNSSLSTIVIGKTYNYLTGAPNSDNTNSKPQILGNKSELRISPTPLSVISKNGIDILFPEHKLDTTTDRQPKLRGIGIPGDRIKITIKSKTQTAIVTVAPDGVWEYRPKLSLEPGSHTITIQGKDKTGKTVTVSEQFVVLKSGEQVLGEATPSGTIVPTNTPTLTFTPSPTSAATISATPVLSPTPTLTPTETPIPTTTPTPIPATVTGSPPRAGTTGITKLLIGGGMTLILIGIKLLL